MLLRAQVSATTADATQNVPSTRPPPACPSCSRPPSPRSLRGTSRSLLLAQPAAGVRVDRRGDLPRRDLRPAPPPGGRARRRRDARPRGRQRAARPDRHRPVQIALLVVLAMSAALLLRGGADARQRGRRVGDPARVAAAGRPRLLTDRVLEGLIGGGVGLAIASLLLPPDPVLMVNRAAQSVVGKLGHTLAGGRRRARGRRHRPRAAGAARRARDRRRRRGARGQHPRRQRDRALLAHPPRRPRDPAPLRGDDAAGRLRGPQRARADPLRAAPHPRARAGARRAARSPCASSPTPCGSSARSTTSRRAPPSAPARAQRRPPRRQPLRGELARADADRRPGALGRRRPRARLRAARRAPETPAWDRPTEELLLAVRRP